MKKWFEHSNVSFDVEIFNWDVKSIVDNCVLVISYIFSTHRGDSVRITLQAMKNGKLVDNHLDLKKYPKDL